MKFVKVFTVLVLLTVPKALTVLTRLNEVSFIISNIINARFISKIIAFFFFQIS